MNIEKILDKEKLFSFFKIDLCLYSYHVGDLDDFFFNDCTYYSLVEDTKTNIREVCLLYKGLSTATVLAFGIGTNFVFLLNKIINLLPDKFFCHYLPIYEKIFNKKYERTDLGSHYKMLLKNNSEIKIFDASNIISLNSSHHKLLQDFYTEAYPETYFESYMLDTGYYFGLLDDSKKIISVTGVHTYSKEFKLAVLGNIATHPLHRGKGYSYLLISYLISKLQETCNFISLNVKADNTSAIKLYKKLGFEICTQYKEALFQTRI